MPGFDDFIKGLEGAGQTLWDGVMGRGSDSSRRGRGRAARQAAQEWAFRCAAQTLGGGSSFVAVLAFSQYFQGAVLRVSCSSPLGLPTALGVGTVALASVASMRAAEALGAISAPRRSYLFAGSEDTSEAVRRALMDPPSEGELGTASFGIVLFRALGGAFSSVAPSALHMPGAFSRLSASLPATLEYASEAERQAVGALGRLHGCHTCGARGLSSYIADHMPPLKTVKLANAALWRRLLRQTVSQRFYPQCQPCSSLQSVAVRSGVATLKYHVGPAALRPHHATGALLVLGAILMHEHWREGVMGP